MVKTNKRIFIVEKKGDYTREYWKLPLLEYPESPEAILTLLRTLRYRKIIDVGEHTTATNIHLIPWMHDVSLYDADYFPKPAEEVFPFPMRNIKTDEDLVSYNEWLKFDFQKHVYRMNNSTFVAEGWQDMVIKQTITLVPKLVDVTQFDVDRLCDLYGVYEDDD